MIDVNDKHLWSEQYHRPYQDIFEIQTEIAEQIASTMQATIGDEVRARISRVPTDNLEAYNNYLLAHESLNNGNSNRAWELFERAIELDPHFSEAYALYGTTWYFTYTWTGHEAFTNNEIVEKSLNLLEQALELDPENAYAHAQLGVLYCYALLDLRKADEEYKIAQRLNPSNLAFINTEFLLAVGRYKEALESINLQIASDPQNPRLNRVLELYFNGKKEEALEEVDGRIELSNYQGNFMYTAQRGYLWAGEYQKVVNLFELRPHNFSRVRTNLAIAQYHLGQQDKVDTFIDHLKSITNGIGSPAYCLGLIHAQMGNREEAFRWLEKAWEERQGELYWLKHEPTWDPIRDDPRFQLLLDKIRFP